MHYQSDGTQVTTRPAPAVVTGTPGYVVAGNPASGQPASDDDPDLMNAIMDELCGVVIGAGLTPSKTNNAQVLQALQIIGHRRVRLTTSGTWSLPAGCTAFRVIVIGAGGGGGSCQASSFTQDASGSGGGAGGRAVKTYTNQASGTSYAVVVGAGGASQVAGGDSSFNGDVIAHGGQPGVYQSLASSAGGQGGTATGGDTNDSGGSGSDGQSQTFIFAGNGAPGPFGGGGRAGNHSGFSGSAPGAGGGGVYDVLLTGTFFNGATGANGCIEIEW